MVFYIEINLILEKQIPEKLSINLFLTVFIKIEKKKNSTWANKFEIISQIICSE